MAIIKENDVVIDAKNWKKEHISKKLEIFYNPVMKFNRDCSMLLLNALSEINKNSKEDDKKINKENNLKDNNEYSKESKENTKNKKSMLIALPLAGSGIRGLRFLKELRKGIIDEIHFNDYKEDFKGMMKKNIQLNRIAENKKINIRIHNTDANLFLLNSNGFDYIDIDPFGTPNPFLDSAVKRISREGILAVTATDTSALAGTYPLAAKRKYFAAPMLNYLMHELGLRILARKVQMIGGQYDKALTPVFSYAKDHYYRIFFKCEKGKSNVDEILAKHKYFLYCDCMDFFVDNCNRFVCKKCKKKMISAGPLWTGTLFDKEIIEKMREEDYAAVIGKENKEDINFIEMLINEGLQEINKMSGTSKSIIDQTDCVGFYEIPEIMSKYKISKSIKLSELIERIKTSGYSAVRTHFGKQGIKSNIPISKLVKIMKEF